MANDKPESDFGGTAPIRRIDITTPPPPYCQAVIDSMPRVWILGKEGETVDATDDLSDWIERHLDSPILAAARDGLMDTDDAWRRRRLIARRCLLVIIEINPVDEAVPGGVAADALDAGRSGTQPVTRALIRIGHWRKDFGDMRPFFRLNGLTKPEIAVELVNLKSLTVTGLRGTDFLFGMPYQGEPDLGELVARWSRRDAPLVADWSSAATPQDWHPHWQHLGGQGMPWCALEAAWRVLPTLPCPNCSTSTIVSAFGERVVGYYSIRGREIGFLPRRFRAVRQDVCPRCQRVQESPLEPTAGDRIKECLFG